MASIVYKSLSSLTPIELGYEFYKEEKLKTSTLTYNNGMSLYSSESLKNARDLTINKNTCLILTSPINLSSIFVPTNNISLGKLPGSIKIQNRFFNNYFAEYNLDTNSFFQSTNSNTIFYIQPLENSNEAEILVNGNFLQVEESYPYVARLSDKTLDPESIHRQRFQVVYQNNLIMLKTKTNTGYRFLAFNSDNILRATGLVLNDSVVNDYVFNCIAITAPNLDQGFIPTNNWITYFYDIEEVTNNRNVYINKNFISTNTSFLIDFPIEQAAASGKININIANLKTGVTPAGGPAPINNNYVKQPITSN